MKTTIKLILCTLLLACCNNDDNVGTNTSPETFSLLGVENEAENVELKPTLSWQSAADVDGDQVVYDLYLEIKDHTNLIVLASNENNPTDPATLIAQGLTETSFTFIDELPTKSQLTWSVVARDNQGGSIESETFRFFTRSLNFRDEAHTAAANFDPRQGHGSVFFKEKFWVIGGFYGIEGIKNDVWSSSDGENWVLENEGAGFSGRSLFAITVFKEKIFILGGIGNESFLNDVWSSSDGVNWVQETANAAFSPRALTKLIAYKDKIYALGGLEHSFEITGSTDDVWSSTNGTDWILETDAAAYSRRYGFEALVFKDKMFVFGGSLGPTHEQLADVWTSTNGIDWVEFKSQGTQFSERSHFQSAIYKGKIWLTGGYSENDLEQKNYTDFWSSQDGLHWRKETSDAGYQPRNSPTLVASQDYMLFIAGGNIGNTTKLNDVWKFD